MNIGKTTFLLFLTITISCFFSLYAEQTTEKTTEKQSFLDILKPIQNAETCKVQVQAIYTLTDDNKTQDMQNTFNITTKGDKLSFVSMEYSQGTIQFFRNGSNITIYSDEEKKYIEREAPKGLRMFSFIQGLELMDTILFGEEDTPINFEVKKYEVVSNPDTGTKEKYYKIETEKGETYDLWFSDEANPQLIRISAETIRSGNTAKKATYYFTDWKLNSAVDDKVFKFTPPEGVTKLEREETKDPLLGKKAPDFTLTSLDGSQVSLKDFKDKKVVVLDFWASWCGPCRMAMPVVQAVSEELKDKDVAFFAVNIQEDKNVITRFIEKQNIKIPVLMDKTGKTAEQYLVQSIPRLVIIGKDGVIHGGHSGFSQGMRESLKKEILDILEGKSK
ncbi:MAG: redoxin family protein [Candidatus Hydrogenedens sp.]|nr:redoxin family protein [Candidatus Hydrogenedens sp.]